MNYPEPNVYIGMFPPSYLSAQMCLFSSMHLLS